MVSSIVVQYTELLRSSSHDLWVRLRELLKGQGLDPARTTVVDLLQGGLDHEDGRVISDDDRVYTFRLRYDQTAEHGARSARLEDWTDVTGSWETGSLATRTAGAFAWKSAARTGGWHPSAVPEPSPAGYTRCVHVTADPADAYRRAMRLCALMEHRGEEAELLTHLESVGEVRRMAAALPNARFVHRPYPGAPPSCGAGGCEPDVPAMDDRALEAHLPLEMSARFPRGTAEDRVIEALGDDGNAVFLVWPGRWPDRPEHGLRGFVHDAVQVAFRGDHSDPAWPSGRHAVHVHVSEESGRRGVEYLTARADVHP
ncbi:hypothetical protein ABT117_37760 [Streptomyces sp. NPDC002262]|uniref:hypothetical protein n=1 Tax=Streptomyces sp. NPDC002262 TaxID=3154414 RepID=UPI00331F6AD9